MYLDTLIANTLIAIPGDPEGRAVVLSGPDILLVKPAVTDPGCYEILDRLGRGCHDAPEKEQRIYAAIKYYLTPIDNLIAGEIARLDKEKTHA